MKIRSSHSLSGPHSREGSAVIIVFILLSIMVMLVAANTRTVNWLRGEVKLVNQQQTARLAAEATNQMAGASSTNPTTSNP